MIVFTTLHDQNYEPLAEWTLHKNKKLYCEKHGYILHYDTDGGERVIGMPVIVKRNPPIPDGHYPLGWGKIFLMKEAMDKRIAEMELKNDPRYNNLVFAFGVGGEDKMNSSSWILEEWKLPKTVRPWGYYRVLHEPNIDCKVKELTVLPGLCLSMQRHEKRSEFWFVSEGEASVYTISKTSTDTEHLGFYKKFDCLHIEQGEWHRLCNETDKPLRIIEIQYGEACFENDIERRNV